MPKVIDHPLANPKERGKRARRLREYLGLSREALAEKHGIKLGTLQNWENARFNGMNERNVLRLVAAFKKEQLDVTPEWLLYGIGMDPLADKPAPTKPKVRTRKRPESNVIAEELRVFHALNGNAIDVIIADNSMMPYYSAGDIVAGSRFFCDKLDKTIGLDCIVQTQMGETLVRRVEKSRTKGYYNLFALNPSALTHTEIQLFSAAPILWIRRKGS